MRPDGPRPEIIGEDSGPVPPFPLRMGGKVVEGFKRGSKEVFLPPVRSPISSYHLVMDSNRAKD
jgi:riboflavin kinase